MLTIKVCHIFIVLFLQEDGYIRHLLYSLVLYANSVQTSIFPLPRGWKAIFSYFLFIQGVGKLFFPIFCSSKGLESHFSSFFAHPRGWKAIFSCFLFIQGVGKPFFSVFCSSETSESRFSQFFVRPRPRKAIFFSFLLIRDLGKPFFLIFRSSETSESRFLLPCPYRNFILPPNSRIL